MNPHAHKLVRMSINPAGAIPAFSLSDRLRKAREFSGLDQTQLAQAMGVSRAWLETGQAPTMPSGPEGYTARDSDPEPAGLASTRASVTRLETWRERSAA